MLQTIEGPVNIKRYTYLNVPLKIKVKISKNIIHTRILWIVEGAVEIPPPHIMIRHYLDEDIKYISIVPVVFQPHSVFSN